MEKFLEFLKVLFLGIVEGITEWLPVSSTGHMLLVDEFLQLNADEAFKEMFFVVIQFGAILAVILLFWNKMFPFQFKDKGQSIIRKDVFSLWFKVVFACIPGAVITLLFDDMIEDFLNHTALFGKVTLMTVVIAAALILYGFAFIFVEKKNANRKMRVTELHQISYKDAFLIGLFQVLSIIPGTSRSGSTIIGALTLGISRSAAAEFTFFLAVPVMAGYSLLKLLKFGFAFTSLQLMILLVGCISAFLTSLLVIRFLMSYVKKHSFSAFGIYRIILGAIVLLYFFLF
ncbi:MAG: undecaprenyl-diphosphate phosphatase [Clostridia bacterium]|nr:undecaprenyl-diphosphate phosphatase [Clostridia bacterium]